MCKHIYRATLFNIHNTVQEELVAVMIGDHICRVVVFDGSLYY